MGVPFDWILAHLKDNHGLKATMDDVLDCLGAERCTMTSVEAQEWMAETLVVSKAVEGVPIAPGIHCNQCHYSAKNKRVMKNHISKLHKGASWGEVVSEGMVQVVFKGRLEKYILVEELEMEVESNTGR